MSLNTITAGKSIENINQAQSQPIESLGSQDSHRSLINKNTNIERDTKLVNDDST
jgi:hypothetical protein